MPTLKSLHLAVAAVLLGGSSMLVAQRPQPNPEERINRLERQVQQMQRQLFPKGRPADTAGFADDPAASQSSVIRLDQRLDSLERQLADIQRLSEENGNRLRTMQNDLATARDGQEERIKALELRLGDALARGATAAPDATVKEIAPASAKPKPKPAGADATPAAKPSLPASDDAGEAAYSDGYKLWQSGDYDGAITALRAFTSAYPKHRRVSYANNLVGRALLDKGEPQAAVQALLANYRGNPAGERAPDSLYYMGQALLKLDRPKQACNAFAELNAVYGAAIRSDLKTLLGEATAAAKCS